MSAYCLFDNVEVLDPAGLSAYVEEVGATVDRYGGRYLSIGGQVERVEGDLSLRYPVLIEFPDAEAARRWYESPEYQPLKALRQRSVRAAAVFFEPAPTPSP